MTGERMKPWAVLLLLAVPAASLRADPPTAQPEVLTAEKAIAWALQYNPELAVVRRQRGIAEANIVIARTYPFNPSWQPSVMGDSGPESAGITNRVFVQNVISFEVEVRGQRKIRQAVAATALSRVEWEIAAQELAIGIKAIRAFNAFVYRQEKLRLLEDILKLQEQTAKDARVLFEQGKVKPADNQLATLDLIDARAQRGPSMALLTAAWNDLRRVMGADLAVAAFDGRLEPRGPTEDVEELIQTALRKRPDLQALQLAVEEADHRVRLEVANRFGNPSLGPKMEYNETRVYFVGGTASFPLPIFNVRRGEILLRQAERDRVMEDRRKVEIQAALDVKAATARLTEAQKWVNYIADESLPALQKAVRAFEKLFAAGDPSVDVLRLIEARRRLVRARDSYFDALWELSQARADLAAAVGDLCLVMPVPQPPPPLVPVVPAAGTPERPQLLAPVARPL
jgi:outer membrane protein TolC